MKKILLPTGDTWFQGIYTPKPGEGRWVCCAAEIFAAMGWEVHVGSKTDYVDQKFLDMSPSNIRFIDSFYKQEHLDHQYDLVFHWERMDLTHPAQWNEVKDRSKGFLLGTFWPEYKNPPLPPNSVSVVPFHSPRDKKHFRITSSAKDVFDPPRFSNKKIFWGIKRPLEPGGYLAPNVFHLQAVLDAALEGFEVVLLRANDFLALSEMNKENKLILLGLEVFSKLCKLPNVKLITSLVTQDEVDKELESSSVLITAASISSAPRAVTRGVVPLAWQDILGFYGNQETLNRLFNNTSPYEDLGFKIIREKLFALLNDESYFNNTLETIRTMSAACTMNEAISLASEAVAYLGV